MTYEIEKRKAGRQPQTIVELDLDKCANRYSESRVNLITQPEDFSHADWVDGASTIITNDATAPDGTLTADRFTGNGVSTFPSQKQTKVVSWAAGEKFVVSVFIKENVTVPHFVNYVKNVTAGVSMAVVYTWVNGKPVFDHTSGAGGTYHSYGFEALAGGWFRFWSVFSFSAACNSMIYGPHIGWTTATIGSVFIWGAQLTEGSKLYDYGIATCNGSQGNLLTRSEEFDHAAWAKTNVTVNANTGVAPDGTLTADSFRIDAAATWLSQLVTVVANTIYNSGIKLKAIGGQWVVIRYGQTSNASFRDIWVDLINGVIGTDNSTSTVQDIPATIQSLGDGWYRIAGGCNMDVSATNGKLEFTAVTADGGFTRDTTNFTRIIAAHVAPVDFLPVYQKTVASAIAATGKTACYNTFKTCQDTVNYNTRVPKTYRFCDGIPPVGINAIPCINKIATAPTKIVPSKGLGYRANVSIDLVDFPHDDRGIDQYLETRNYDTSIGTFFGKLYARNPFYQARNLRVKSGYVADTFDEINDFITKHYVIEKFDRNSANGKVRIVAKDPLKLADNDRAQCPVVTSGALSAGITAGATSLILTTGTGAEYGASGYVRINDEIIAFASRTTDTLNSLTRAQYGSTAAAHSTDDKVQLCKEFASVNITDIVYDLLVNFANVPASFIDTVEWNVEEAKWLSLINLTSLISEPTGVLNLLQELTEENLIDIWWDEKLQTIRLNSIIPDNLNTEQSEYNDDNHIIADSITVVENTKDRVSQVWVYYAVRDYTQSLTSVENFAQLKIQADATSESADAYGDKRVKKIYSRWFNAGSTAIVNQSTSRLLQRYKDNQPEIKFDMDAKDSNLWTGDHFFINTKFNQDETGAGKAQWMQVMSVAEKELGTRFSYHAQAVLFTGRFAFIAPSSQADYTSATDDDKTKYGFIAFDSSGFPSDSGEAYKII